MSHLLLFGGIGENFPAISCDLLLNNHLQNGLLVLLVQNVEIADYCKWITKPWNDFVDVCIVSLSDGVGTESIADTMKAASIVAIGPGKTMVYGEAILNGPLGGLIMQKVYSGAFYIGISAGAILAGERLVRDTASGVQVFPALGLVDDVCIEPHYDTAGKDASLMFQMKNTGLRYGLGIGNAACLEVVDGSNYMVHGEGACAVWKRDGNGVLLQYEYHLGMTFTL